MGRNVQLNYIFTYLSLFQARVHDESLKYVLSGNAIVLLAKKVPVTETDISTTISQADTHLGFLNSNHWKMLEPRPRKPLLL